MQAHTCLLHCLVAQCPDLLLCSPLGIHRSGVGNLIGISLDGRDAVFHCPPQLCHRILVGCQPCDTTFNKQPPTFSSANLWSWLQHFAQPSYSKCPGPEALHNSPGCRKFCLHCHAAPQSAVRRKGQSLSTIVATQLTEIFYSLLFKRGRASCGTPPMCSAS